MTDNDIKNCVILQYIPKLARHKKLFIQFTYSDTVTDLEKFASLTYVAEAVFLSLLDSSRLENKFTEKQRDVQLYQKEPI